MLSRKSLLFLNFILGVAVITAIFHLILSFPIEKALIAGLSISLFLDLAYLLENRLRRVSLNVGDIITIAFLIISGFALALGIHHIVVLPLIESLAIATIITTVAVFGYLRYAKGRRVREDVIVYSGGHFLLEAIIVLALAALAYISGLSFIKSAAVGLFIFIPTQWYYNQLMHKYVFRRGFVALRLSLIFLAMLIGWIHLVKAGVEISLIVALFFTLMMEVDRRFAEKLARFLDEKEKKAIEKRAGAVFQPLGLAYGMVVGVMAANNIYGTAYFVEWQLEIYRLAYIFAVMFGSFLPLGSWLGFRMRAKRET